MESKCEESKYSEDKPIVELVNRNLMSDMICYAQSSFFVSQIENFKQEYRGLFQSESKSDDDHSLEQTNIFQKFQEMIDSLFEKFAISQNSSIDVLYENCRDAGKNLLCLLLYVMLFKQYNYS